MIRGRVVEAGSGRPIASATVLIHGPDRQRRAGTFTAEDGTFHLDLRSSPADSLHVERLGYAPLSQVLPTPAEMPPGGLELVLTPRPIAFAAIEVTGETRCALSPEDRGQTHDLWEATRVALRAAELSVSDELVLHRTRTWRQRESQDGSRVEERTESVQTTVGRPFETLPPDVLARQGYVRHDAGDARLVRGPDARVLLSDEFASDHCFEVVRAPTDPAEGAGGAPAGKVGLAFEPAPEPAPSAAAGTGALPEVVRIGGTIWIDAASGELRRVDFQFLRFHPERAAWVPWAGDSGGSVHYRSLPDGRWVVEAWRLRVLLGLARSDVWYDVAGGELLEVLQGTGNDEGEDPA